MFDELRTTRRNERMTVETAQRHPSPRPASSAASERRAEALIAAYIHELSPRHRAEREATNTEPDAGEVRT